MKSITYIGMDVHTTNYTLCCYSVEDDRFFAEIEVKPDYQDVLKYINRLKSQRGKEAEIMCGYEAGCLGYSLYHQLTYHGVDCVILAPSTMPSGAVAWMPPSLTRRRAPRRAALSLSRSWGSRPTFAAPAYGHARIRSPI